MGTSESRPLELIYGEFRRALETGDIECALDLMAMAALAAWSTPAQIERDKLWDLARIGVISAEFSDIRRDQDFETAALRFAVSAASPLASALSADVGASMARRQGWIHAWDQLRNCHPASNSESIIRYSRAVGDYLEAPSGVEPSAGLARVAREVEQKFADYSGVRPMQSSLVPVDDEDGPENETRIIDELESFLDDGESAQALNLLAVSWCCATDFGLEGQAISELVARSANLIRDAWDDSTEVNDLMSRLWVTAYSELIEQIGDEALEDLGLPGFEAELPPLSDAEQQILQSSLEEYEARQFGWIAESENDNTSDDEVEDADADSLAEAGPPRHERLMDVALNVIERECSDVVHRRVSRIYIGGAPEYVLVISVSDTVGWLRIKDGKFVWRGGSFATGQTSEALLVENPEVDESDFLESLWGCLNDADESQWPPPQPADGEAEEFVRSIENGRKPPAWSQASNTLDQRAAFRSPAPAALLGDPPVVPVVPELSPQRQQLEFNPYIHDSERNPAASGFTEKDLDGVPLITVYPAVIPAIIGGAFLAIGFMGAAQYEFYVVLRWAVTSMAIWMCVVAGEQRRTRWSMLFAGVALLFNPLIPVTATREFWVLPDLVGAALFAIAGRKLRASRPATHDDKRSL